jgi:hypothetical protein
MCLAAEELADHDTTQMLPVHQKPKVLLHAQHKAGQATQAHVHAEASNVQGVHTCMSSARFFHMRWPRHALTTADVTWHNNNPKPAHKLSHPTQ